MDYRTALSYKMRWEKEFKPTLKIDIATLKRIYADNEKSYTGCLSRTRDLLLIKKGLDDIRADGKSDDKEEYFKLFVALCECKNIADESKFMILDDLSDGKDKTNGGDERVMTIQSFVKCEEELTKRINIHKSRLELWECAQKQSRYEICAASYAYNGDLANAIKYFEKFKAESYIVLEKGLEEHDKGTLININDVKHEGEDGYNELCKNTADHIACLEKVIEMLTYIKGEVKDVLKAGKRMNKRNKKQRKDDA